MTDLRWVGLAGALLIGGFGSWYLSLRRIRWVRDTPTARIRSAAQGIVELSGRAHPPPEQRWVSPMTAQPAVWWDCTVSRRDHDSGGRQRWHTVAQQRSEEPFQLDDGYGVCMIQPAAAQVTAQVRIWYGTTPWPHQGPPANRWGWLFDAPYRYTEKLLPSGQEIYVLGEFRTRRIQDEQNAKAQMIQRLAEWKQDPQTLLARFDRNGDGQIDASDGKWLAQQRGPKPKPICRKKLTVSQSVIGSSRPATVRPSFCPSSPRRSCSSRHDGWRLPGCWPDCWA